MSENDDILNFTQWLEKVTGDKIKPTDEGIFEFFRKHCSIKGYEPIIYDDGFLPAYQLAQDHLIEAGIINPNECMRVS